MPAVAAAAALQRAAGQVHILLASHVESGGHAVVEESTSEITSHVKAAPQYRRFINRQQRDACDPSQGPKRPVATKAYQGPIRRDAPKQCHGT